MTCNTERNRLDDKKTSADLAMGAAVTGAGLNGVAGGAVVGSCPFFWTGLGTAACAGSVVSYATTFVASAGLIYAGMVTEEAYLTAKRRYEDCLAKCKKK